MLEVVQQGTRILIVDDHPLSREGLSIAVRTVFPGAAIVSAGSVAQAAAALKADPAFRLILLDYYMNDSNGFSGLLTLQHVAPTVPIVMASASEEAALIEAARALGASGFLFKSLAIAGIVAQLDRVAVGGTCFPAQAGDDPAARVTAVRARVKELSRAQRSVVMAMADGRSNKEIARTLDVSEATVKAHLTAIFRKLGVANRSRALLALGPLFQPAERSRSA